MGVAKPVPSVLVSVAQAFGDELVHLEQIATQLEQAAISSEKGLLRAGGLLDEAGRTHEKLGACLGELVAAIDTTRTRQDAALKRILVETQRVQTRNHDYGKLMTRFVALGARAKEVSMPVGSVVAKNDAGAPTDALLEALAVVEKLTEAILADADAVVQAAKEGDWPEVARDAQALRQSMHAARNKVALARRDVASRATS